ncbi:unnamed protein product [Rhodiola kirilowii]
MCERGRELKGPDGRSAAWGGARLAECMSGLQEYYVETVIATIVDGGSTFKIDTQHLRDLTFRNGSIYRFIGELNIQPDNEGILNARVGRNVDGIDLNLYRQSIKLLRQFQTGHMNNKAA